MLYKCFVFAGGGGGEEVSISYYSVLRGQMEL